MEIKILNFGGGVNSVAMILAMQKLKIKPDLILFADTGSEMPHTYETVENINEYLEKIGFPQVTTIRKGGKYKSLEEECLTIKSLPSKAYGYSKCSQKYKIQPMQKAVNGWLKEKGYKKKNVTVIRFIGIDAGETRRIKKHSALDKKKKINEVFRYPLVEIDWDRDECFYQIEKAGLARPRKSSCFFCPMMKTAEIMDLKRNYPELLERALKIESLAKETLRQESQIKGLGINKTWGETIQADEKQLKLFSFDDIYLPCHCNDFN